jgi:hypothetical protein
MVGRLHNKLVRPKKEALGMTNIWLVSLLGWVAVTAGVIALAIYRNILARGECDVVHLRESELPLVPHQEEFAHRLETLDFWGKALTVASVSYGFLLGALFLYQIWRQGPGL